MRAILLLLLVVACAAGEDKPQEPPRRREVIVVTGGYEPIPLEEADRSVAAFDVAGSVLLLNSIADVLRLDPALDLRQRAPNAVQSDLSIRGGTFGQTLVLLDGFRLNDAQSGHHNMDVPVPLESIERVEVLRGSGSALYGSDAVGGAVQFITREPEAMELRFRTAAGNFGVNQQRGSLGFARRRISQILSFARDFSSGFRPNRDYRNLSLGSSTLWKTGLGSTRVLLSHNDRPFGAQGFYGSFPSWERTKTWFAGLRQQVKEKTEASFAFRRHTDLFVLYRDQPQVFANRHTVEAFQAAVRRRDSFSRTAVLHYGAEGYRDAIESTNLGSHVRGRGAGYAAFDVRSLRRFSFTLAARQEVHGRGRSQFSPSASFGVWLNDRLKLRAGASRAFRLPSYTDLYYHDPANRGSPDLRPERAASYEAGVNWNGGRGMEGELAVFHRRDTDVIDYIRSSPDDLWRATNIHRLKFTGVETTFRTVVARSHSLEARYAVLGGATKLLPGLLSRYVFNYPSHAAVAGWQGTLPLGLLGRARLGITQRRARDPYALLDVYVARGEGRLRPFLQLTNLSGAKYEEIAGVPMPGRGVVGGIELIAFSGRK